VIAPLDILFEDQDCLAVVKSAGQFTQGTWAPPGESTLEQAVRHYLDPEHPDAVYLGIVHRLDRPTSGVLIWAKTSKAARRLSTQFEGRRVRKEYWALVDHPPRPGADRAIEPETAVGLGPEETRNDNPPPPTLHAPPAGEDTWSDWLTRTGRTGLACLVAPGTAGARPAVTRVRREVDGMQPAGILWLRLWPETGRTHQLRAQAAARGMPILGDVEYGSTASFGAPHTIALHARSLEVRHPILQTPLTLVAPVPRAWGDFGISLDERE
jgi:23S rRNA pseudouridine1911/1915/1917 synthase